MTAALDSAGRWLLGRRGQHARKRSSAHAVRPQGSDPGVQHRRIEFAVEQPGDQAGVGGQAVDQLPGISGGDRQHTDLYVVGAGPRALHPRLATAVRDGEILDRAAVGIAGAARQPVVVVDLRQGLQPLRARPTR